MKKLLNIMLAALLLTGCGDNTTDFVNLNPPPASLRQVTILHYNNPESAFFHAGPGLEEFGGVARFATVVERLRAQYPSALLLSSGDGFAAGTEFEVSQRQGVPYYDAVAQDLLGLTASAVGNQELDFGPEVFAAFVASFSRQVPFLSSNLDYSAEPNLSALEAGGRLAERAVVDAGGVRVGLVGVTSPAVEFIASPRDIIVDQNVAEATQREIDALEQGGVDVIVVLSNLLSLEENQALIAGLNGADIVIAATPYQILANPGDRLVPGDEELVAGGYPLFYTDTTDTRVPVVTTGSSYKYVGRLTAYFDAAGRLVRIDDAGPVRVAGGSQSDAVQPDPVLNDVVVQPLRAALDELAQEIVATSQVALDATESSLYAGETNAGNLVADALLRVARELAPDFNVPVADVAFLNSGAIPANRVIAAGPVSAVDIDDLLPFPSFLSVVEEVSAADLKRLLENGVSRVESPDARFPQIAGFRFTYDLDGTAQTVDANGEVEIPGTRIREVVLADGTVLVKNGQVVNGAPGLTVATLDFLARGGDQYPFHHRFTNLGLTYKAAVVRFLDQTLDGTITSGDYPAGGEGRISRL